MKRIKEKIRNYGGMLLLSSIVVSSVTSCGSSIPNTKTLEVNDVYIPGIASEFIEVIDGSYELKYKMDGETERIILPIKLRLKKDIELKNPGMGYLNLNLLDAAGVTFGTPELEPDGDKVRDFLNSEVETEVTLNFTVDNSMFGLKEGDAAKIMNNAVNFEFDMTDISGEHPNGNTTSQWDGELDLNDNTKSINVDNIGDIMDKAKDLNNQAMEKAKEMQEEAMKKAEEMMKGAF